METTLRAQLDHCLTETQFTDLGTRYRGKVRDAYTTADGHYILITTDRISAFDHVLKQQIPFKGQVLNQIAAYFFEATKDIAPNHVITVPDPNVTVSIHCDIFPIEFVVRGYLVGHAWREYRSGKRILCGVPLAEGLRQNQRFEQPILTPTTKATEGHDMDISKAEILEQGLISPEDFAQLEAMSMALFARGTEMAAAQGLILVDTKYEFGRTPEGKIVLVDEVHTPDSSRYFYLDSYADLFARDEPQRQLSKEFVREWLMANGFQGKDDQTLPDLPDDFRIEVAQRYIELFEKITGRTFMPDTHPDPAARIHATLATVS